MLQLETKLFSNFRIVTLKVVLTEFQIVLKLVKKRPKKKKKHLFLNQNRVFILKQTRAIH